ncbi:PASTA domain-containing protein [Isoptericola haloaureus]|uniref:PASTA domain-containing protein n=1 Tax=Isoptericola haloaureus TaxID=1542902 RepID=A0ABU7Z3S7_9MICO
MAPRAARRVLGIVLGLLLGTAAVVDSNPTLSVEPGAGAPETEVSVVVQGFTDCPDDTTDARRVELLWDGDELLGTADLQVGSGATTVTVPAESSPGPHVLLARCTGDPGLQAEARFDVFGIFEVTVPDVRGTSPAEAEARLAESGLVLGEVVGEGDLVAEQDPPAGTPVEPETGVDVVLAPVGVDDPEPADDGPGDDPGDVTGDVTGDQDPDRILWALGLGLGLLVLAGAAGTAAVRRVRRRRARRWVREHVRLSPGPTSAPEVRVAEDPASDATLVVRLVGSTDAPDEHLEVIGR